MSILNKTLKPTDSEAIGKLLLLLNRDSLVINEPNFTAMDEHTHITKGYTSFFFQNDLHLELEENKAFSNGYISLKIPPDDSSSDDSSSDDSSPDDSSPDDSSPDDSSPDDSSPDNGSPDNSSPDNGSPDNSSPDNGSPDNISPVKISLADISEWLNLNPQYDSLYQDLKFNDVTLTASASDRHDFESLRMTASVLAEDEGKWQLFGTEVHNPLPLKKLDLAVTINHRHGSYRKNIRATVTAKLTIDGQDLSVVLSLPVGNQGLWQLRLLPPGLNFSLSGLRQLFMGSGADSDLASLIETVASFSFNLEFLNIDFDPGAKLLYQVSFGLTSKDQWNISLVDSAELALKELGLVLALRRGSDGQYTYQGQINGTLQIGSFAIAATIPIPLTGLMTLHVNTTQTLPSLGQFTDLLGGSTLTALLPTGLSDGFSFKLRRLQLTIDMHAKQVTTFALEISSDSSSPLWPIWSNHLEIETFDLAVQLQRDDTGWQISGTINGRGLIEGVPLSLRIEKAVGGPWKISLMDPILIPTGLRAITSLTKENLAEANSSLPASIEEPGESAVVLRQFQLHLQKTAPEFPYIAVYVETKGTLEIFPGLTLWQAAVVLQIQDLSSGTERSITGQVGGKILLGDHQLSLTSAKNAGSTGWTFQGKSEPGKPIPLTALFEKLLSNIGVNLPHGVPDVFVSNLDLAYTPSEQSLTFQGASTLELSESLSAQFRVDLSYQGGVDAQLVFNGQGTIRISNTVFTLTTAFTSGDQRGWAFTAATGNTILLTDLLRTLFADTPLALPRVLPLSLSVSDMRFEVTPRVKYFLLEGTAAMAIHLAQFALDLTVTLNMLRPEVLSPGALPERLQLQLNAEAQMQIAQGTPEEIGLHLTGTYNSNGEGWRFTGSSVPGQSIPIGRLMTDLAEKFGIDTNQPRPLETLSLRNLAATFNTVSRDFSFAGAADFDINDLPLALMTKVQITHRQDGTSEKSFSGSLTLGTRQPKVFDLRFSSNLSSTLLLAAFHSSDGDSVSIADLLGDLMGLTIPAALAFSLRDAVLVYDANPNDKKVLFVTHLGNGLDLSKLPLVNKVIPDGQALKLNYQIVVASAAFDLPMIESINRLLPSGISPLAPQSIAPGLGVAALLTMGNETTPLALPIAVNDTAPAGRPPDPAGISPPDPTGTSSPADPIKSTGDDASVKWINLQKIFGPVYFHRIGVQYADGALKFLLDASLSVAGLTISLDGLSVASPLTRFEPVFDLKGLGIDYKNAALEVGAAFLREHIGPPSPDGYDEYDGLAILKMKALSLSAIGSYAYVDGEPSLFLYAALNYPIGGPSFFFVTGLSAGFGYNRALHMPTIDKVLEFPLVAEALNGKALPDDAGKEALAQELRAVHRYIPPAAGQMFLAAGIRFTSFKLIDSVLLLAASFGNRFELDLIGVSTLVVPPKAGVGVTPLAVVQLALKGAFIPEEGFVGLQGQLTRASYVLSRDCHLSGGFAFFAWYSGEHAGDFIATIGGYHPRFKKPKHYPNVPRLALSWRLDAHTQIKGEAYFALCAHVLMAGGSLAATYHNGALKAWFKAGADFLVAWKPYHYEISAYVKIGCDYTYHFFGTHHLTIDVSARVNIWGPEFAGHAVVDLGICSIEMDFGASRKQSPAAIGWNAFKHSFLPEENLCNITVRRGLVSKGRDGDHLGVINPKALSIVTDAFIPSKEVTWGGQAISNQWTTNLGIGAMGIQSSQLICSQTITVEKHLDGNEWQAETDQFHPIVHTKKVPAALWGHKLKPGLNDPPLLDGAFAGLEIVAGSEPIPGQSKTIDRDFVRYEIHALDEAIQWEGSLPFDAVTATEDEARAMINTGVVDHPGRDALLEALGISDTVDLNQTIAADYLVAPQIKVA